MIGFDADTSGITSSKSALESLKSTIEKDTKALSEMQAAMSRLKGHADVVRFDQLTSEIDEAENGLKKLEKEFAAIGKRYEKAAATGQVSGLKDIYAEGLKKNESINKAREGIAKMRAEQDKLGKGDAVKALRDLEDGAKHLQGRLGQNQLALARMGGTMDKAAEPAKDLKGAMQALVDNAAKGEGAMGGLARGVKALQKVNPIVAAAVVAIAALVAGLAIVTVKLVAFAIQSADAARSVGLIREASAVGSASAKELEGAMLRVEGKTNAQREAVDGLINEYSRLRLTIGGIESATSAITVATAAAGQAAGSAIKGLIDRGVDTKRFWLGAFDLKGTGLARGEVAAQLAKQMKISIGAAEAALRDGRVKLEDGIKALDAAVEARFGEVARRQMLALPVQLERARKNLGSLFKDVNIEPFLEKLHDVLSVLDETSEAGKAIRQIGKTIFQPLVDGAGDALPLVEGFIYGVILVMQDLTIMGLKAAIAIKGMFGGSSFTKNLDVMKIGVMAAGGVIGGFVAILGTLAAVMGAFALSIIIVTAPLWMLVVTAVAIGMAVKSVVDSITQTIDDLATYMEDTGTSIGDAVEGITDAIIKAVEDGAEAVWKSFKDLALGGLKAFKSALGIASPSKLFRAEARWIPAGVAEGIEQGQPQVSQALATLAEPEAMAPPPGRSPGTQGSSEGRGVNLVVNYYGAGSKSDAERFGGWLLDELETGMLARGYALSGG